MVARLRVAITPDDVGRRVSVRLRVRGDESTWLTDVVGRLESWNHGELRIRRRNGEVTTVAADTLVAGKVVPDPPRRV